MTFVRSILRSPSSLACAAMLALSLMLAFGLAGAWSPWLDAFSHFRAHFALAAALLALGLLATRFRLIGAAGLVFALACFSTVPGLRFFSPGPVHAEFLPEADGQPHYRLLQMNLRFDNATPEKVLSLIAATQPDIVTVEEVSPMWRAKLDLLSGTYPNRIYCGDDFGAAILSRHAFAEGTEARCFTSGTLATATVDLGDRAVDVAAIHMGWPWPRQQTWQIASIAPSLAALGETAIAAGDFNAAPWSGAVRRIAALGGLTIMPSVGPTWMWRRLPDALRFAGLPIDQVLSKGDVVIHSARKLAPAGSDHLPILVEFSLKAPADGRKTAAATAPAPGVVRH